MARCAQIPFGGVPFISCGFTRMTIWDAQVLELNGQVEPECDLFHAVASYQ